jgi:hypothetical protein
MHGSKSSNPSNARTVPDMLSDLHAAQASLDKAVFDADFDAADPINAEIYRCLSALRKTAMIPNAAELAEFRQIMARHDDAQDALAKILLVTRGRRRKVQAALSAYSRM